MFKKLSLNLKLIASFLGVGLIPLIVVGVISLNNAGQAIKEIAFNQLHSIQVIKKNQIEGYFQDRFDLMKDVKKNLRFTKGVEVFTEVFKNGLESSQYNAEYQKRIDGLQTFNDIFGFYDIFLIDPKGNVVFTVAKEADLGEDLIKGKLNKSGLAKAFEQGRNGVSFIDFAWYDPSNEPASFIAVPLNDNNGLFIGVAAFQVSLKQINEIMSERTGMGETGETYLIGRDKLMRSDSYLDPTNHSVTASFKNPATGAVDTEAARDALAGNTDQKIIIDYNGNPVLSAYAPMKIGEASWAILAEIDEVEAFASIKALTMLIVMVGLGGVVIIAAIAWLFSRSIAKPLKNIFRGLKDLSNQELGETTNTFKKIIEGLNGGADQVASASGQLSSSSQSLSEGASEQASSLEEISSSLEEMASMTRQSTDNTSQADNHAKKSVDAMIQLKKSMEAIKTSSDETAKIVKTIDEIAMQTNLLALNAAVEAARAGEAGRGFAVVAEEVRNLAQRSAEAAKNTSQLIEESQKNAEMGVDGTSQVQTSLEKVSQVIAEVSAASKEQSQGIDQINDAIAQMDKVTQQNAANSEESASASEELSGQAQNLSAMVAELIGIVEGDDGKGVAAQKRSFVGGFDMQPGRTPAGGRAFKEPAQSIVYHNGSGGSAKKSVKNIGERKALVAADSHEVKPEDIIPLDDVNELKEF